jgi:hypothetical protein
VPIESSSSAIRFDREDWVHMHSLRRQREAAQCRREIEGFQLLERHGRDATPVGKRL